MRELLGVIPARWASSRFPGKPLAMLGSKPMIQWVYERASAVFGHLVVATDDQRITEAVSRFGGNAVMTSPSHRSGTERCAEAYSIYRKRAGDLFSHVVNVQGDEPLIRSEQLEALVDCLRDRNTMIATLIQPLEDERELEDPNRVKVVVDNSFRALYFSRASIPYIRDREPGGELRENLFYCHIGLYGFRSDVLEELVKIPPAALEMAESLEQLRWMVHGIPIQTRIAPFASLGVDTPQDLERIRSLI